MQIITGTMTETGVSQAIYVEPGETIAVLVEVADMEIFEGTVVVERSRDGVNFETAVDIDNVALVAIAADMEELEGEIFNTTIRNTDTKRNMYRVRATVGADDGFSYSLTEISGDRITILLRDSNGRPVMWALDNGNVEVAGLSLAGTSLLSMAGLNRVNPSATEAVTTNGDAAVELSIEVYHAQITTGGSEGNEDATIGDGTGAVVGQRKLISLTTQTHASDVVVLDHANIVDTDGAALDAASIDDEGGFLLVEWNGTAWQVIYSGDATLTPS